MKKTVISLSLILTTALMASDMPPMPPGMGSDTQKNEQTKEQPQKKAPSMPKECANLPPMVVFLPPPMEAELVGCKNAIYKPPLKAADAMVKKLYNEDAKALSVTPAEGFERIYAIEYSYKGKQRTLYCNKQLERCIYGSVIETK